MINPDTEHAKVTQMKNVAIEISDSVASLSKSMNNIPEIFQGDRVGDSINELVEHSKNIDSEASSLSSQIDSINGIIDAVYEEELEEQRRASQKQIGEEKTELPGGVDEKPETIIIQNSK